MLRRVTAPGWKRLLSAAWCCLVIALGANAWAVPVRVRGSAILDGRVSQTDRGAVLRLRVTDEASAPLDGAELRVSVVQGGVPVALPRPASCAGARGGNRPSQAQGDEYVVVTDSLGEACVVAPELKATGTLRLTFRGDDLHERATTEVPIDDATRPRAASKIELKEPLRFWDLDAPSQHLEGRLTVSRDRGETSPSRIVNVVLEDEQKKEVARASTDETGTFKVDVPSDAFGGPGPGEIAISFAGDSDMAPARLLVPIVKRLAVETSVPEPPASGDPQAGIEIHVSARSKRGEPVSEGLVEAFVDGVGVGVANVQGGEAAPIVVFPRGRAESATVTLRYVPASESYVSGSVATIDVKLDRPSMVGNIVLAAVVVTMAAWLAVSWRRAPKRAMEDDPKGAPLSGRPGLHIVRTGTAHAGWSGVVTDAHDGFPIVGATLKIVAPTFQGDGIVATATSGASGEFSFPETSTNDARLVVSADLHSDFEQALPPPSVISILLVTRRRALLDRLVRWARKHGSPYEGPPEPTPGHVRRAAGRAGAEPVARWAGEVEKAAFGVSPVDAETESRVRADEPKPIAAP